MALVKNVPFHGIILYRRNYRERDMLIKFLTAEYGTKMFMIRRGRTPNFKLRSDLLPFTYGNYTGNISSSGLSYIKNALETHHYLKISDNIILNAYATYLMTLLDAGLTEGSANHYWFHQLYYALLLIDQGLDPDVVTQICEVQLLSLFGVKPQLDGCVICQRVDLPLDYSTNYGGLLCAKHWHLDPRRFHLDQQSVKYLRWFNTIDLSKIKSINVQPIYKGQLRKLLDSVYNDTVGLHLKSKQFLDQIKQL